MSFQKPGSKRTSVIGNGSAFHLTLATDALVRFLLATSTVAVFLSDSSARAGGEDGSIAAAPAAAARPRKCLRLKLDFIGLLLIFGCLVGSIAPRLRCFSEAGLRLQICVDPR